MKAKTILSLLSVLFLSLTLVMAIPDFSVSKTSIDFQKPSTSNTFVLSPLSINSTSFALEIPSIKDKDNNNIPISISGNLIGITTPQTITVTTSLDYTKLEVGTTYSGNLIVRNLQNPSDTKTIVLNFVSNFCKFEENDTLDITNVEISNSDGDDLEWSPLDPISIDVEVTNNGDKKVTGVVVEIGVFDSDGKNIVNDLVDLNDKKQDIGSLSDGDDSSITFDFKVPTDFTEDSYKLVLKAYSTKLGERASCIAHSDDFDENYFQSIDGVREDDKFKHIIVDNIRLSPETAQCSDKVQVTADAVNIGDEDYEDQIKVNVFNSELKLNKDVVVSEDFNQGDSSTFDIEFDVPADANEKTYNLEFKTYYDYNTNRNDYRTTSNQKFTIPLKVLGNCNSPTSIPTTTTANAQITAELDPETPIATAGKELIINSNIKNTGDSKSTYTLSLTGASAWSSLVSIEPQVITLEKGESRDFNIILNLDNEAVGNKEFNIKANYGDKSSEYKVTLSIDKSQAGSTAIINHFKDNWYIYVIVLINLILIIAIIMVIRRMLRPRRMPEM